VSDTWPLVGVQVQPQAAPEDVRFRGREVSDMWTYVGVQVEPRTAPKDLDFEVVVVRGSEGPAPAILFPHGGPHSAYSASYMLGLAFLAGLGYTVLAVNFR
jgi:dipeptidyl aminopeptidase/acylaminoacyl peptidase